MFMDSHLEKQALPETLYHYTSQAGLIGILNTRSIWASKIHYLNDAREFALALDLARRELERRMHAEPSEKYLGRLELLRDKIYTIESINICVCSFSELGDSLSQWRGYGGGRAEFSVGFSGEWFRRARESLDFSLTPCVYDTEEQERFIREAIDWILAIDSDAYSDKADYWDPNRGYADPDRPRTVVILPNAGKHFADRLAEIAPLIKDASFKDEREWRLISRPIPMQQLEHRPGESMMIPYYSIPIGSESEFESISEIVIGPTPHPDLSEGSVRSLAFAAGITTPNGPTIRKTRIPFRNW